MNDFEVEVKEVYEELAGRPLSDDDVQDIAFTLRQFAAFIIECAEDPVVRERLGYPPLPAAAAVSRPSVAPRVAPRAVSNPILPNGESESASAAPITAAPTGEPIRGASRREAVAFNPEAPDARAAAPHPAARACLSPAASPSARNGTRTR